MRRDGVIRWSLIMAVALFAFVARADIPPFPFEPVNRAMTRVEWGIPVLRPEALAVLIPIVALLVLISAVCISRHRRNPRALVCVAYLAVLACGPIDRFVRVGMSILGVGVVAWIAAMIWRVREGKLGRVVLLFFTVPFLFLISAYIFGGGNFVTIKPESGESYEEYTKRVRREYYGYCPNCDTVMSEKGRYRWERYRYCDNCGYGKRGPAEQAAQTQEKFSDVETREKFIDN